MKSSDYNLIKAATWYTIGNILIKGTNFFVLPIFTRLMSTHEYGIYSVYTSYLMIFETAIMLGLSSTIVLARYAKEVEFDQYISTVISIPLLFSLICMVITNIGCRIFGSLLSMNAELWTCLFISSGAGAISNIIGARLVIEGRYKLYMASSAIKTIGDIVLSLILVYTVFYNHDVHLARVYGSTSSFIIGTGFILIATKTKFSINRRNAKYAFAWGIPLLFHTLATVVLTQSDRILIRYFDSYSSAGIYAVATTVVTIPMVLQQSLSQAWTPWFYGKLDAKDYEQIRWLNNRYIVLYSIIIAGFMLLAPDVIHLFTEQSYWPCVYSLVPLAISVFAELMYSIPTSVEYYNKRTTYIMTATLITVVLNIFLDVVFIKLFGYHGAAYATALSKVILFLMHLQFSRKLDKNALFSGMVAVICFAMLSLLTITIVNTIDLFVIRYAILISMLIPAGWYTIKNKDLLISKIKEKKEIN